MTTRFRASWAILLIALLPAPGRTDTTIRLHGSPQAANAVIQVKGNLARLGSANQPVYVIYDKSRNLAVYVDTTGKTYTEIDRPTLEKYAGMMSTVRQQLQRLPPAQRALIEQHMGGLTALSRNSGMPDLGALRSVARGTRVIGGFHCQLHELLHERQPVGDVCLSTAAEAGITRADFATLMAMMDFMRHAAALTQEFTGELAGNTRLLLNGLRGVPIAVRDFQSHQEFRVADVSGSVISANLFNGYRGYRRQNLLEAIPLAQ
jgi:hypothetical protein